MSSGWQLSFTVLQGEFYSSSPRRNFNPSLTCTFQLRKIRTNRRADTPKRPAAAAGFGSTSKVSNGAGFHERRTFLRSFAAAAIVGAAAFYPLSPHFRK
jgi:hypothetical protein